MPNLVGTGLNQVPTNSMLGGLAYQDPEHASIKDLDLKNLSQINSEIADTAVDVFVYDTRKDSDGGAWRKRTQNTSWYNETLGTATRGTRKEFPAVAVIVAETTKVTIYDGDDPDLPMWMVFNVSNTTWFKLYSSGSQCSCVTALNATLCAGGNGAGIRLAVVDFIKDNQYLTEAGYTYYQTNGIVTRNDTTTHSNDGGSKSIVNNVVNDVAMTVLPNAPIDDTTGLPVPTIAVATAGGLSVIKDDGRVVDIVGSTSSTYKGINKIHFTPDNKLAFSAQQSGSHTGYFRYLIANIPNSDLSKNYWQNFSVDELIDYAYSNYASSIPALFANNGVSGTINAVSKSNSDKDNAIGGGQSLTLLSRSESQSTDMGCYITSDYNTGWMHGDIKGAFLSDTDTTNAVGGNLVTNGTFGSDSDWEKSGGWVISGGSASMPSTSTYKPLYQYNLGMVAGKKYVATVNVSALSGSVKFGTTNSTGGGIQNTELLITGTGAFSYTFIAEADQDGIGMARNAQPSSVTIDNITVALAEEDRSVNNNPLQVFGTVTKSAVATGADLVAYHGINASNYLKQPYNSDLDFGTGDFSILVWVLKNTLSSNHYVMDRSSTPFSSSGRSYFIINTSGYHRFRLAGGNEVTGNVRAMQTGVYNQVGFVRRNGQMEFYLNGDLVQTVVGSNASASFNSGGSQQEMVIDRYWNSFSQDYTFDRMTLFRISGSAPSAEQVKKMYEDEKCLFHENAKATLYGSSDAVTALSFDDTTNLLHVGTSAGRSEFQGLRRINNTTTAVTTAISASNGLVAEQ